MNVIQPVIVKKKNVNIKGITLIELIISISLISVVLIFLFSLLVDVRHSDNQIDYDRKNQQKRAIIIKRVQDDLLNEDYTLTGINNNDNKRKLKFVFNTPNGENVTTTLEVNEKYIKYTDLSGNTEKWLLDNEASSYSICIDYDSPSLYDEAQNSELGDYEFFAFKIRIPLLLERQKSTGSEDKNNVIDDLEFFYIGKVNDNINFIETSNLGECN